MVTLLVVKVIGIEVYVHLSDLPDIVKIEELGGTMGLAAHGRSVDMVIESLVCPYVTAEHKRGGRIVEEVDRVFHADGIAVIQLIVCPYRVLEAGCFLCSFLCEVLPPKRIGIDNCGRFAGIASVVK